MKAARSSTLFSFGEEDETESLVDFINDIDDDWKTPKKTTSLYEFRDRPARNIVTGRIYLQNQDIPYMHVDATARVEDVLKVIIEKWNIPKPRAVLDIVSDTPTLYELQRMDLEDKLVKGLINASRNVRDMWIITKGLNIGLSQSLGNAFYVENLSDGSPEIDDANSEGYRAELIGICQEDILTYSENLLFPKHTSIKLENSGSNKEDGLYELNPYHSHFIFVRDTSITKYGFDNFLLKFEEHLSKKEETSCRVPVIAILVHGSASSIQYILEHLKMALPVIIIKGSGGLADLLAFAYYEVHRRCQSTCDSEYRDNLLKPSLFRKISFAFPTFQDNKIARDYFCDRILECITLSGERGYGYLYILDAQDSNQKLEKIQYHILEALFLSQRENVTDWVQQPKRDLLLTVEWNCADIAMSEVILTYPKFKVDNSVFETVLFMENREAFVSLFLQCGFKVHQFLSSRQLLSLFSKVRNEYFFHEVCWKGILGYEKDTQISDDFIDSDLNFLIELLTGISVYVSSEELDLNYIGMYTLVYKKKDDAAFAEQQAVAVLIIWALLSCKLKVAEVIWQHSGLPVIVALTSSLILESLLQYTKDARYREELMKYQKKFAEMATDVFNLSYDDMPCRAFDALDEKNAVWEDCTLVQVARMAKNKEFVSLPCCQKWISNAFSGNIRIRELTWGFLRIPNFIKVILSALLIFPMYIWVVFQPSAKDLMPPSSSEIETAWETEDLSKVCQSGHSEKILKAASGKYPPLWKMVYYTWTAPITKFWLYYIFYFLFLALLSITVVWPSCGLLKLDAGVCFWISTMVIESIYCTYKISKGLSHTFLLLKIYEVLFMSIFVGYYILARVTDAFFDPYVTKVLLCVSLLYFFYRAMYTYLLISPTLGPRLYTLKLLITQDFVNFMCLTILVMISNGIILQAIIYPDFKWNNELIRRTFHRAWVTLFITPSEEYNVLPSHCVSLSNQNNTDYGFCQVGRYTDYSCPNTGIWPCIFSLQYYILLKLVLFTLLFALFSDTHDVAEKSSTHKWKFDRHQLVVEYSGHTPLPPPLNILIILLCCLRYLCRIPFVFMKKDHSVGETHGNLSNSSHSEFRYWKNIVNQYMLQKASEQQKDLYIKKKLSMLSEFNKQIENQENAIFKGKSQIAEMEVDTAYTRLIINTGRQHGKGVNEIHFIHIFARQSPYPGTKLARFPVPDKFVPWEVKWLNYEPEEFTLPPSEFSANLRPFVDGDLHLTVDRTTEKSTSTSFRWNIGYTDAKGIYHGRDSWITEFNGDPLIYKLHNGLPQNPMGRTGMKGRGSLANWGPNHYIYVIVTRWKQISDGKRQLEFIETWHGRRSALSLPGGYVTNESRYYIIQEVFGMTSAENIWKTMDDMIQFFESCLIEPEQNFESRILACGYMDDPLNTDQAWKEVEAWHIHYSAPLRRALCVKPRMAWHLITEHVFTRLPGSQGKLVQKVLNNMNISLF